MNKVVTFVGVVKLAAVSAWREAVHGLAHFLGFATTERMHGYVGGVTYVWEECRDCGRREAAIAYDSEADRWYVPGGRELRHNVQLIREMEDP